MTDDAKTFWQELRTQVEEANGLGPIDLDEADRRMAAAGRDPIAPGDIDAIVTAAVMETAPAAAPPVRKPALAAAVGAFVLLGLAIVGFRNWPSSTFPGHRLGFELSVELSLDGEEDVSRRKVAIFRLYRLVQFSIAQLQAARTISDEFAIRSNAACARLRNILRTDQGEPRKPDTFVPPEVLAKRMFNNAYPTAGRLSSHTALIEQAALGVRALGRITRSKSTPSKLRETGLVFTKRLDKLLLR